MGIEMIYRARVRVSVRRSLALGGAPRLFQRGVTKIICNPRVANRPSPAVLVGAVEVNAYW